jgi:peptide/nickel transport system permease protein
MKKYLLTRVAVALPVILLVSVLSFLLVFLAPGDPASQYRTLEMTDEEYEQLKTELGYNDPVIVQYGRWLNKVAHGDFGVSSSSHTKVWPLIKAKLPATIGLMLASIVFSLVVAIPLGMLAGCFEDSVFDKATNALHYAAISVPSFWFAIMLIILFSLKLGWLPSSGMRTTGVHTLWDLTKHAIMPVVVLSIGKISIYARYVRAATIQQMSEDYVLFAISKGASRAYILFRHVLKNCLLPVITLVGMNLGSLVSGAYIVESIFGWPGLGTTGMSAIYSRDYNMIMGTTMLSCLMLVLGNLIADVCYSFADPRIKAMRGEKR